MDGLFGEISSAAKAMNIGGLDQSNSTNFNPYAGESSEQKRPSADYTDAELMQIYENIQSGNCPPEMKNLFNQLAAKNASEQTKDGKPVIDSEGGTVIQPSKGFVVKTKDMNTGGKLFINMTQHEIVDNFE